MEAIAELFVAFIVGVVELAIALFEVVIGLITVVVEFVILVLTQGLNAALERQKRRREERAARAAADSSAPPEPQAVRLRYAAIYCMTITFLIVCGGVAWIVQGGIRKQRIAETRTKAERLADRFAERIRHEDRPELESGSLPDRDAWQQPLVLIVERNLLECAVIVRSCGPDAVAGSIDDIHATRMIRIAAQEAGGEVARRGLKAMRDRVIRLLPGERDGQSAEKVAPSEQ